MSNLNVGGAEKALVSLLQEMDHTRYEIDLLLFKQEGLFLAQLPKEVNLLPEPKHYRLFDGSFKNALKTFSPKIIYNRYRFVKLANQGKNPAEREQYSWKAIKNTIPDLDKEYDVAIGYLEKNPIYYVVDKVKAQKKIGFVHNDYKSLGMDKHFDYPYFSKLDYIATVSDRCLEVLNEVFPEFRSKIKLVPNMISPGLIKQSAQANTNVFEKYPAALKLLSIGRLEKQKGYDLAIKACKILIEKGYEINWFILGEGQLRKELELLIEQSGLQQYFYLLGIDTNPYQYMQQADIVVQTSLFEGKSIAVDEAKILAKPIILTNFTTAKDQIENGVNGLICEMNPEALVASVESLLKDENLKVKLSRNLAKEDFSTENEIEKLIDLL